jgi:class 3 adenylate cyclase
MLLASGGSTPALDASIGHGICEELTMISYRYNSLEDFLISNPLNVNGVADDGWGATFPVKGREIEAAILFADISSFSARTLNLSSTETLIYVNNFFAWITAEALRDRPGIVDKYIGDEIMVVFSEEFGSKDPFVDAVQSARMFAEKDLHNFSPHMGIARGVVTVGYVGTPLRYNCSVFGSPVALAARCAAAKLGKASSGNIVFPAELWRGYKFEDVLQPIRQEKFVGWKVNDPQKIEIKNMPDLEVICLEKTTVNFSNWTAEERAKETLEWLESEGLYTPRYK